MTDAAVTWFGSKVDWWLGAIIVALPLIQIGGLVAGLQAGDDEAVFSGLAGCAVVVAIYGFLLIPIRYGISRELLIVRFGVVRSRIRLADITEVYPSRNPLSSPALSLDRLAVRTTSGRFSGALISPKQREEFLTTLAAAAGLQREGDRLVRRPRDVMS